MFFITVRGSTVKFCATLLLGVMLVCSLVFVLPNGEDLAAAGGSAQVRYDGIEGIEEMAGFLAQFGWQVGEKPVSDETVTLPQRFDGVFAAYNDLQRAQGLDLAPYEGKRVRKTVLTVTNYEGYDGAVIATLFVYRDRVIAGDLSSGDPQGFTCGFDGESG